MLVSCDWENCWIHWYSSVIRERDPRYDSSSGRETDRDVNIGKNDQPQSRDERAAVRQSLISAWMGKTASNVEPGRDAVYLEYLYGDRRTQPNPSLSWVEYFFFFWYCSFVQGVH